MRTAIVGLGITGLSCVRYLHGRDELLVLDTRPEPPGLAELLEAFPDVAVHLGAQQMDFSRLDRIVVSPGVSLEDPLLSGRPADVALVSDVDLFCEAAAAPVIAVTGTNGKSTVTSLVGHLLQSAGKRAVVGGNLGEAALGLLSEPADIYVLELSSFQLERLAPHRFLAASVLNVSEDHLDRHGAMDAYVAAKQRIYRLCDLAVAQRDEAATYPPHEIPLTTFGPDEPQPGHWGIRVIGGVRWLAHGTATVLPAHELPIAGRHNEQNALAAMALAHAAGVAPAGLSGALRSFQGLPHRCQRIARFRGVEFINDSKATNVGATEAALLGLVDDDVDGSPRIVLIAGGDGKGADFAPLAQVVARTVKALVLLGRDAGRIADALGALVETRRVADMDEAVALAHSLAEPGDLVLLSPACASLDMYPNFAARGDHFGRAVEALAA